MIACTKKWQEIPFAHRSPFHKGHCRFIHGHNWVIEAEFTALTTDENGFVMDFGGLKPFWKEVVDEFDHALVLSECDPFMDKIGGLNDSTDTLLKLVIVDDCSCEGLAKHFHAMLSRYVRRATKGRVTVSWVRLYEDQKNSAIYKNEN